MEIRTSPAVASGVATRSALRQRVMTASVLGLLLLSCLFLLPATGWQLLTCVPIALAAAEWARLAGYQRNGRIVFILVIVASCLAFVAAFHSGMSARAHSGANVLFALALMFWAILVPMWLYRGWHTRHAPLLGAVGWMVLVPAWLAAAALQQWPWLLLAVLLVVWIADIAAYFAGHRFGRRKLAPLISPGKTWEGVIGAFAAVLVYGIVASLIFRPSENVLDHLVTMIFVAAMVALSIVGDLFESWIKRGAGAKDSGTLLPGHGGILDRIDSLTAALPFAALYFLPVAG